MIVRPKEHSTLFSNSGDVRIDLHTQQKWKAEKYGKERMSVSYNNVFVVISKTEFRKIFKVV